MHRLTPQSSAPKSQRQRLGKLKGASLRLQMTHAFCHPERSAEGAESKDLAASFALGGGSLLSPT